MKGLKRVIIIGVAAFVSGAIIMFPARIAYHWFAPDGLQLSGIGGTIWSGSANEGLTGGMYFRKLSWDFKPLALLTGKLEFSTKFDPAAGFMDADIAISAGGVVTLSNVAGAVPLGLLQGTLEPLRGVQGSISLQLETLVIDDGLPTTIIGKVGVANLTATMLSGAPVGDYQALFTTDSEGVRGVVKDVSGVLDFNGVVTITEDRAYSFIGQVAPRPDTPASILQQLRMLGSPDASGKREFRLEGQF